MYDEKVEIQKIFDRMKPFKVKRVNQNNLIHILKHLKAVQSMVFKKDHIFKLDDETSFDIDIEKDLIESKLQLDAIFSEILQDDVKQEIVLIHKQLANVIENIRKKMEQQKREEEEERLRKVEEEKKNALEEEKKRKKEKGIESEVDEDSDDEDEENKHIKPPTNDLFKRKYDTKDLTIEKEEENKIELINELEESAKSMKTIAIGIRGLLDDDTKVTHTISMKLTSQKQQVKESSSKLDEFFNNRDLGWIEIILMMLICLSLTIFSIVFIHLW